MSDVILWLEIESMEQYLDLLQKEKSRFKRRMFRKLKEETKP